MPSATDFTLSINGGPDIPFDPATGEGFSADMDEWVISIDESDIFTVTEHPLNGLPSWNLGDTATLTPPGWSRPGFIGRMIEKARQHTDPTGVSYTYTFHGLRYLANQIYVKDPLLGQGQIIYNRPPTDFPFYSPAESGLSVGVMLERLIDAHSGELATLGIVGYDPANTAQLYDITPPTTVTFSGMLMDTIDNLVARYHGDFWPRITWSTTLRGWAILFVKPEDFADVTFTIGATAAANTIDAMSISYHESIDAAKTRIMVVGYADIVVAYLETRNGTLTYAWTSGQQGSWTYYDFVAPTGQTSEGSVVTLGATSATLNPTDAAESGALNHWSGNHAKLWLINSITTGADFQVVRDVTSSTAYSSGGNVDVTWAQPLAVASYTTYRMVGFPPGGMQDVWCLFNIVPTYVKNHLALRMTKDFPWKVGASVAERQMPIAAIDWTNTLVDAYTYISEDQLGSTPMMFQIDRVNGQIRFPQPVVSANNSVDQMKKGGGTVDPPYNVRAAIPYSVGTLEAVCPADAPGYGTSGGYGGGGTPVYSGTAFDWYGVQQTGVLFVEDWIDRSQLPQMEALACMLLKVHSNVKVDCSFDVEGFWDAGAALDKRISITEAYGATVNDTGHLKDMKNPMRGMTVKFEPTGNMRCKTTVHTNNKKRPAVGEDLFIRPHFTLDPRFDGGAAFASAMFGGEVGSGAAMVGVAGVPMLGGEMSATGFGIAGPMGGGISPAGRYGGFGQAIAAGLGGFAGAAGAGLGAFAGAAGAGLEGFRAGAEAGLGAMAEAAGAGLAAFDRAAAGEMGMAPEGMGGEFATGVGGDEWAAQRQAIAAQRREAAAEQAARRPAEVTLNPAAGEFAGIGPGGFNIPSARVKDSFRSIYEDEAGRIRSGKFITAEEYGKVGRPLERGETKAQREAATEAETERLERMMQGFGLNPPTAIRGEGALRGQAGIGGVAGLPGPVAIGASETPLFEGGVQVPPERMPNLRPQAPPPLGGPFKPGLPLPGDPEKAEDIDVGGGA